MRKPTKVSRPNKSTVKDPQTDRVKASIKAKKPHYELKDKERSIAKAYAKGTKRATYANLRPYLEGNGVSNLTNNKLRAFSSYVTMYRARLKGGKTGLPPRTVHHPVKGSAMGMSEHMAEAMTPPHKGAVAGGKAFDKPQGVKLPQAIDYRLVRRFTLNNPEPTKYPIDRSIARVYLVANSYNTVDAEDMAGAYAKAINKHRDEIGIAYADRYGYRHLADEYLKENGTEHMITLDRVAKYLQYNKGMYLNNLIIQRVTNEAINRKKIKLDSGCPNKVGLWQRIKEWLGFVDD